MLAGKAKSKHSRNKDGGKHWYADRFQTILVQRNLLAVITFVSLLATVITSFSVMQLTPLKSVQPFLIKVDEQSGATTVVDPMKDNELSANQAIKRYFIMKYIRSRETYNVATYRNDYNIVRLLSERKLFETYKQLVSPNNEISPVNEYGRHSRRQVTLRSLTFIDDNNAQVRITISYDGKMAMQKRKENLIVWLTFDLVDMNLTAKERYVNPLGFQVTNYKVDEELSVQ